MLLLLPVAYLLAAGRWWALAIPLATAVPLVRSDARGRLPARVLGRRCSRSLVVGHPRAPDATEVRA